MVTAGRGVVVTIGSIHSGSFGPGLPAYAAAKAGLTAFTRQVAVDYGRHGVRAVTVAPGWIGTAATEDRLDGEADRERQREAHPLRRLGDPADVAAAVAFAVSDGAAMLTGTEIVLDGGATAVQAAALLRAGPRIPARPETHGGTGMTFDELLAGRASVAILRGLPIPRALGSPAPSGTAASTWWRSRCRPRRRPRMLRALAGHGRPVGAGTVLDVDRSPRRPTRARGSPSRPAWTSRSPTPPPRVACRTCPVSATPTEAQQALRHGLTWLKAFPAISLGPAWFKAVAGPLPQLRFVATGGLDAGNAHEYLTAGARALGVGGAVTRDGGLPPLLEVLRTT